MLIKIFKNKLSNAKIRIGKSSYVKVDEFIDKLMRRYVNLLCKKNNLSENDYNTGTTTYTDAGTGETYITYTYTFNTIYPKDNITVNEFFQGISSKKHEDSSTGDDSSTYIPEEDIPDDIPDVPDPPAPAHTYEFETCVDYSNSINNIQGSSETANIRIISSKDGTAYEPSSLSYCSANQFALSGTNPTDILRRVEENEYILIFNIGKNTGKKPRTFYFTIINKDPGVSGLYFSVSQGVDLDIEEGGGNTGGNTGTDTPNDPQPLDNPTSADFTFMLNISSGVVTLKNHSSYMVDLTYEYTIKSGRIDEYSIYEYTPFNESDDMILGKDINNTNRPIGVSDPPRTFTGSLQNFASKDTATLSTSSAGSKVYGNESLDLSKCIVNITYVHR